MKYLLMVLVMMTVVSCSQHIPINDRPIVIGYSYLKQNRFFEDPSKGTGFKKESFQSINYEAVKDFADPINQKLTERECKFSTEFYTVFNVLSNKGFLFATFPTYMIEGTDLVIYTSPKFDYIWTDEERAEFKKKTEVLLNDLAIAVGGELKSYDNFNITTEDSE